MRQYLLPLLTSFRDKCSVQGLFFGILESNIRRVIILFFFYSIFVNTYAQTMDWPDVYYSKGRGNMYNVAPVQIGYIVLNNHDTLYGEIKLPQQFSICSIIPGGKDRLLENIRDISFNEISCVRVFLDSSRRKYSDFINVSPLGKGRLWRLLEKVDDVAIYDDQVYTYNYSTPGYKFQNPFTHSYRCYGLIFIVGSQEIKISKWPYLHSTYNHLLRFMNKHYQTKFKKGYFKTSGDMISFIVKKENEISKQKRRINP